MASSPETNVPVKDATHTTAEAPPREDKARPERILLVPYPKIVFLYPTYLVSLVAAIYLGIAGRFSVAPENTDAVVLTWLFLGVLGINMMVLAFDFPRATSLTVFLALAALVLGATLLFTLRPDTLPAITGQLRRLRPVANATFFGTISFVLTLIYIFVFISVRFDYWEVRPNELLHHHGFLSDLKRFSAPNLRIDKEINDVFEFMLLGSGRLILQPSGERRAVILDNVLFINRKEEAITQMLGALQVDVRTEPR